MFASDININQECEFDFGSLWIGEIAQVAHN